MAASYAFMPKRDEAVTVSAYPASDSQCHVTLYSEGGYTSLVLSGMQFEALRAVINDFAYTGKSKTLYVNLKDTLPILVRGAGQAAEDAA